MVLSHGSSLYKLLLPVYEALSCCFIAHKTAFAFLIRRRLFIERWGRTFIANKKSLLHNFRIEFWLLLWHQISENILKFISFTLWLVLPIITVEREEPNWLHFIYISKQHFIPVSNNYWRFSRQLLDLCLCKLIAINANAVSVHLKVNQVKRTVCVWVSENLRFTFFSRVSLFCRQQTRQRK